MGVLKVPFKDVDVSRPAAAFAAAGTGWILLDQLVKFLQRTQMSPGQSIPLIPKIFHLTYLRNEGAAFSILDGQMAIFIAAAAITSVAIFIFWRFAHPKTLLPILGTALLLGGALGNVIDRVAFGHVFDLFDLKFINFAVFNVADIGITIGIVLIVIWMLFFGGLTSPEVRTETNE